ncbi:AIPR family protein [Bradyrhizobium lablabi]|uniref:AIPR family protein n=1 Tax=Bradyrhizobium lablabi TaxID=722472 RepID=UPI001BAE0E8E|nr:AIPR family protein [Bradyrhizobium lablabi]MBR0695117.1 AIPR family protein [Bradyrhizobium lablabi]
MSDETYKTLLDAAVEERSKQLSTDASEAFENLAVSLLMMPYDLSVDEIDAGMTDGSGDGQIDAMFVVVNGAALSGEETDELPEKGPLEIDIVLIQSKKTDAFAENPLKSIRGTVNDLLDLNQQYSAYLPQYSQLLQDKFALARKALLASAGRISKIRVRVYYASSGSTANIHATVHATAAALKSDLAGRAATTDVAVDFYGAEQLVAISRLPNTRKKELEVQQSISSDNGDSFACLVTIEALIAFLSDEKGNLIRGLFDANVRDFLGKTEVNDAIWSTLENLAEEDFWWLNNGITIVASNADQKGKKLAMIEPLLVNGLQTSNVIFTFMNDLAVKPETKALRCKNMVLAKIIVPPNEKVRDEIIKATNSQTHIPKPYLRGMDRVHRNIEDHLKASGLFYERRKNQYKNAGKARSSIVTLSELAQALMAAFLFRSSDARGRPNSLLKSDVDYQSLFSEGYDLDSFKNVILAKREIAKWLASHFPDEGAGFRNNVIFHILTYLSLSRFHTTPHAAAGWANPQLDTSEIGKAIESVVALFKTAGGTDQVAKSLAFQATTSAAAKDLRDKKAAS